MADPSHKYKGQITYEMPSGTIPEIAAILDLLGDEFMEPYPTTLWRPSSPRASEYIQPTHFHIGN
jgi:hypothetical protein